MSNAHTQNPHLTAFAAAADLRAGSGLMGTWLPTCVAGHDPHRLDRGISR
jgi:hypothetical protein